MALHSILVVNNSCNKVNEYQYDIYRCTEKFLKLDLNSNTSGPFNIYLDSTGTTAIYSGLTRNELISGVTVSIEC